MSPPQLIRSARVTLAAASLALLAIPFALIVLLVQARWAPLLGIDHGARDNLHRYAVNHSGFVTAMQLISDSGSAVAWSVMLTPAVGWLLWRRLPRLALFVVITAIGSSLLNSLVKATVDRQRPVLTNPVAREHGLSFPSGHAQAAIVGFAVLLIVLAPILRGVWRRTAVTTAVLAVMAIGFSRVALGVHYLSDVLGGLVLGAAWVAAMSAAFDVFGADREHRARVSASRSAGRSAGRSAAGPEPLGGTCSGQEVLDDPG
ncbi:MAG: hypothetical protein QOE58_1262 [Actinomycetota bacterium]|nr:hypothetical protein [Actinomycetota bacterium]